MEQGKGQETEEAMKIRVAAEQALAKRSAETRGSVSVFNRPERNSESYLKKLERDHPDWAEFRKP